MKKLILLIALFTCIRLSAQVISNPLYSSGGNGTGVSYVPGISYNFVPDSATKIKCRAGTNLPEGYADFSLGGLGDTWKIYKASNPSVYTTIAGPVNAGPSSISGTVTPSFGTISYTGTIGVITIDKNSNMDGLAVEYWNYSGTLLWTTKIKYADSTGLNILRVYKDSVISNRNTQISNANSIILKLGNDSTRLTNDSINYLVRILKLSNDSSRLTTDSINYLSSISFLKSDTTSKGTSIRFLQTDTTNKGIQIGQLQTNLANKHDTVYTVSSITSDTLKISIHTGISQASPTINSLKVYPNPASTILHIDLASPGYFTAKISGVTGQSIITPTSGTIDISALANGIYILTIYDSNGKLISTNKFLISK